MSNFIYNFFNQVVDNTKKLLEQFTIIIIKHSNRNLQLGTVSITNLISL